MSQEGHENNDFNTEQQMNFKYGFETSQDPENFGVGVMGAVLGALVGSIPWFVVINMGWFIGWLAFLIGTVSLKGYAMFKGPKKYKFANLTIWISSLLVILLMNFIMVFIQMNSGGIPLTMFNIKFIFELLLKDPSFYVDIAISMGIGIFGLVGIGRNIATYVNS